MNNSPVSELKKAPLFEKVLCFSKNLYNFEIGVPFHLYEMGQRQIFRGIHQIKKYKAGLL